jgi:phosphate starvation-inducible PhoH-like protein
MDPWIRPIFDIFLEFYSQREIDTMMNNNMIEISPLAYMRGRTFKRSMIIADEMQNSSPNQMLMLITRIGKDSKMVITGDLNQTDKQFFNNNGLHDFIERMSVNKSDIFGHVDFARKDIQRSKAVSEVLKLYGE